MAEKFEDVRGLLEINGDDLEAEFLKLPALVARWSWTAADAAEAASKAKHTYERVVAEASEEVRAEALSSGGPKPTESRVEALTLGRVKVIQARDAMIEAESRHRRFVALVEGLRAKRDCLIQLGASHREQMKDGISFRETAQQKADRESRGSAPRSR